MNVFDTMAENMYCIVIVCVCSTSNMWSDSNVHTAEINYHYVGHKTTFSVHL